MRLSFDYLVSALQSLDDKDYRYKEDVAQGHLALNERQALIQGGLVEYYEKRSGQNSGAGRCRKSYRLTLPYEDIKVGHFMTYRYPHTAFERHLFAQFRGVRLAQLDNVVMEKNLGGATRYSAERLIRCLTCLSHNAFVPLYPTLYRVTSGAHRIMRDMITIGLVEVTVRDTRGKPRGYKLTRPLTGVSISMLLPYLYTTSVNRQYYNRLFYAVKDYPVSCLLMS